MKCEYFEWNGERSTSRGIYVSEQPPIMIPVERVKYETVAGKSGVVAITEGEKVYKDVTMTVKCWVKGDADLSSITSWMRGEGKITFGNRPEGYYKGRLSSQAELKRFGKSEVREFSLVFRCQPYLYLKDNTVFAFTEPVVLENMYNETALPIIRIEGTGDIDLTIQGKTVSFTGLTDGITVNSEIEEAYNGSILMNNCMVGAFPVLEPGMNAVSFTGDVTSIEVIANWRKT